MGTIILENIRLYAYHGCLPEETKIGSDYRVDLEVKGDLGLSSKSDALEDTIDYVFLNRVIAEEMAITSKLLETVAKRILGRIISEHEMVKKATVSVSKLNPPIGGDVQSVTIKMTERRKK
ncbi:dihydroneopterin aldolase [Winogradskyella sp. 3972H.M.0a.05]|uniref:dihydroneopterin aldolase n=1 Tax=Winogradskyella sp. 3972H.M.0a.05 TaxID=2950277 RepID=UPI003398B1AB